MGLFPCTFKRASAVVLTVALGLCAANVRATKIEFSVPASEIDVPDQQKELKKDAKAALRTEISFKGGLNVGPMAAPVMVAPAQDPQRDPFTRDKDKDKSRNGRPSNEFGNDNRDAAALAEKYKAAQSAEAMRTTAQDSLSSTAWQMNRQSTSGRDASREADSIYNPRERSVGWSTLFKEAQEERDRKEHTARINDFKALYETHNSMSPIGTPAANTDPMKDSLWRDQAMSQRNNRDDLYSRRDDPAYGQPLPGSRGVSMDSFGAGPARNDSRNSTIAPIRDFEQHHGVLEFPKRPGDLLK
jgi:hypothetical protein